MRVHGLSKRAGNALPSSSSFPPSLSLLPSFLFPFLPLSPSFLSLFPSFLSSLLPPSLPFLPIFLPSSLFFLQWSGWMTRPCLVHAQQTRLRTLFPVCTFFQQVSGPGRVARLPITTSLSDPSLYTLGEDTFKHGTDTRPSLALLKAQWICSCARYPKAHTAGKGEPRH